MVHLVGFTIEIIIAAGFILANMHQPDSDIESKLVLHPSCKNILFLIVILICTSAQLLC